VWYLLHLLIFGTRMPKDHSSILDSSELSLLKTANAEDSSVEDVPQPITGAGGGQVAVGKINWEDLNPVKLMCFTGISVVAETALTYPMWMVKTIAQTQTGDSGSSMTQIFKNIRGSGGFTNLYRGFGTYALLSLPSYTSYVALYNWSKSALGYQSGFQAEGGGDGQQGSTQQSSAAQKLAPMASGLFADFVSLVLYVPVDLCVQRMQVTATERTPLRTIAADIYRQHGLKGFYKGSAITVATSGVISGVWWVAYENLKKTFQQTVEQKDPKHKHKIVDSYMPQIVAGSLSSMLASTVANPLDVLKTRIQVMDLQTSMYQGFKDLIKQEGLWGTWKKGLAPKLLMVAPLGAISSFTYELVLYFSVKDPDAFKMKHEQSNQ
jgi:solute carrier family 25 protein 38